LFITTTQIGVPSVLPSKTPLRIRQAKSGHPFITDGGHWIIDARLGRIDDPAALAHALATVPGVVEHGLFIGLADTAIIGGPTGVKVVEKA
jgi:ribose 5-phosphate isomerase A